MSGSTNFYVQRPADEYWNTAMGDFVIKASNIDPEDASLPTWQRTAEFVKNNLRVLEPKDFSWPIVRKNAWAECKGPARKLDADEYVFLYNKLDPSRPLPPGHEERLKWLIETGRMKEIEKSLSCNKSADELKKD